MDVDKNIENLKNDIQEKKFEEEKNEEIKKEKFKNKKVIYLYFIIKIFY